MNYDPEELLGDLDGFDAPPIDPTAFSASDEALQERCDASYAYRAFRDIYQYDVFPQPHLEAAEFIDGALGDFQFSSGGQQLYMIGWPRNTFKTTLFAQGLPSLTLGRNPNARILIDSFRHDVSKRRLRAVKQDLEFNPRFHEEFGEGWKPEFREEVWNDDSIYVLRRTNRSLIDPSIACAGVDRSMTGAHFDLIVADDLVTDTNVRTGEMRNKVYEHILDLLPILDPNGVMILIFTRWHVDDAYGRLMRIDDQRKREKREEVFKKTIRKCHNPDGTLFFPARLTEDFLQKQRERIGSRKFASQYDNEPLSDEDRTFSMERSRVRNFDFWSRVGGGGFVSTPRGQQPVVTTLAWDPAGRKGGVRADSHGLTVCGTDLTDLRWVCEAKSLKGKPSEIIQTVVNLMLFYKVWAVSIEQDGGGGLWGDLLKAELDRRKIPWPYFHEYSTGGVPKNERIATAVQPRWERGGYIVKPDQHVLINQIESFSISVEADHEDVIDSLAQHESFARVPDGWVREDDNPIDPEFLARRDRVAAVAEFNPVGASGTRWDVGSSLTRADVPSYD